MPVFDTPEPITLKADFPAGDLVVTASERGDTRVRVSLAGSGRREDAEYAAAVRVDYADGVVVIEAPDSSRLRRTPSLDIVAEVPSGSGLVVDTASADVRAQGRFAGIEFSGASGDLKAERADRLSVKTVSGDVTCDIIEGVADITSTSGKIRVATVSGPISTTIVSGRVHIGEAGDDVAIKAVSGDVTVRSVREGKIAVQTTSGDVAVGVPHGSAVWLDVSSLTGRVTSALDRGAEPGPEEKAVEITARSLGGDISITRAGAHR